ncbi:cell surface protein SprA [Nibrella viscosa]|uniref:Cell surface protein SprA n=1 Tax=Nibrella viscosa TaxID=1084524 RepID=A0ABP8KA75_9BACT
MWLFLYVQRSAYANQLSGRLPKLGGALFTFLSLAILDGVPTEAFAQRAPRRTAPSSTTAQPAGTRQAALDSARRVAQERADSLRTARSAARRPTVNWVDRYTSRLSTKLPRSPFILRDPKSVATDIRLDSADRITVYEQIRPAGPAGPPGPRPATGPPAVVTPGMSVTQPTGGLPAPGTYLPPSAYGLPYRPAESIPFSTYEQLQTQRVRQNIWREYGSRRDGQSAMSGRGLMPRLDLPPAIDRIFGGNLVDFLPNGFVMLDFGYLHQFIDNPTVPVRLRRQGNFIFNEQISINFNGKIGEKLGMLTNFDTKASFNFENALRLNYKTNEENIIQKIEAGNLSWPINSQLIPGVQNLFGLKTQLKFGRLNATVVASQQRSKQESIVLRGGAMSRQFEIRADQYDENRHFFLSQFFRNNYERALKNLPVVMSGVTITRLEVYVTNRTNTTATLRNIVGFADLAEANPHNRNNPSLQPIVANSPASNNANGLYARLQANQNLRQVDRTTSELESSFGFTKGVDYDLLRGAKRLSETEYKFQPELGYISLVTPLRNDEILAVAYEYTYQGRRYQVGELTEDYQNRGDDEVLFLKLLKSATIRNNIQLPMWDLMMKNIYSLNTTQLNRQGFQLRILYKDDLTGIDNPNLQEGRRLQNRPLVQVFNMDQLNQQLDKQPDGNFDFVENVTVDPRYGKIMFPVLEPFGSYLERQFDADEEALRAKYVFPQLYRLTQADAIQVADKNKFFLRGTFQSATGQEITLPYGVNENSVQVTAGGVPLMPGQDYVLEAQIGRLRIINEGVLNSGREIRITYERPDLFQNQIRTLLGTRLDYQLSPDINLGMTAMHLRETPAGFLTRVAIGNEPVNNTIVGLDANIRKESRALTRFLDRLPLLQTKEVSTIHFQGEVAQLFPGVAPRVNNNAFIDDFEAARTIFDLTRQPTRWRLGATPQQFPQGTFQRPLEYAYNRARISVYSVDQTIYGQGTGLRTVDINLSTDDKQNYYERYFLPQQLFPGRSVRQIQLPENVLDVAYFPSERGMYNFNPDLTREGNLRNPRRNFGAVTRAITSDIDFDNANIENITFWMMDPFIGGERGKVRAYPDDSKNKPNTTGGKLFFNLGEISEDVVKDGRFNFENGLPLENGTRERGTDTTAWGRVPRQQFITNAFTNQPGAREKQDVGLDGLSSADEQRYFSNYLNAIRPRVSGEAFQEIAKDPANDDFQFYLGPAADSAKYIVARYKRFMGMEGNSPENDSRDQFLTPASTNLPDIEDLNLDNTINDNEAYYEYEVDLRPGKLAVGQGYIIDKVEADGATWYLFRIPVREAARKVGNINGFKSIRFMRMYLTDFEEPVVLRFAQLQMEANQYRKYTGDLSARGLQEVPEPYDAKFVVSTVNIEENSQTNTNKYVYTVPPGFQRDRDFTQLNNVELNEQAMSLCVTNLRDGDSRAAFRNTNFDFLFRKRLKMFIHMHPNNDQNVVGQVSAFIRVGTDFTDNYYEIEVSNLQPTPERVNDPLTVWPAENELDLAIEELINLKAERNRQLSRAYTLPFSLQSLNGRYKLTVVGNPDLSSVQTIMIGVRNPKTSDEQAQSFCIWVNEFRASGFDQTAGNAAVGSVNAKLADFATVTASGRYTSFGFGGVQTKVGDRTRESTTEFGISSAVAVDKLLPERWGLRIPVYLNYDNRRVSPHFNPLDPDTPLETSLSTLAEGDERARYRRLVEENSVRKGINFSNVRKVRLNSNGKTHFWDIENFSFTYAFNEARRSNIQTDEYTQRQIRGGIAYTYSSQPKPFEPFKNVKSLERSYLLWLKDFNLTLLPTLVSIRTDMDRSYVKTQLRNSELTTAGITPMFEKYFLFNRYYDLTWNLTRNLLFTYKAVANSIIDEPFGEINTQAKQDSVWRSVQQLGRMKNYLQEMNATYRIPFDKFPLLDWVQADANYRVGYQFQANSFGITDTLEVPFGNVVRNNRERGVTGRVDFVRLYNKIRYLRFANTPSPVRKNFARSPGDIEEIERQDSKLLKNFTRALLTVRGINFTYTLQESTILPGFLRTPRLFGLDETGIAPGLPFVLGDQDRRIHYKAAERGWLSPSTIQNVPFTQTISKTFNARTTLEPFKDFRMQIEARLTRSDNYQEFYRPAIPGGTFESQSPVRNGQFSMSFLSFRTAFTKQRRDNTSPTFERLEEYREIILRRVRLQNPNPGGEYNKNSQDVLIPAFFAAYSGEDPQKTSLSPFYNFPLPNWRVDYNGLSNLPFFKRWFSSVTLAHSYNSTYSVGNFVSSLEYNAQYVNLAVTGYPPSAFINPQGNYIPVFIMSTITMSERFAPLLGVQFQTRSRITGRLEYNQDRSVALSLSNSQVAELTNKDLTATVGFTRNNIRIPFRINGAYQKLKNDLTFSCSLTLRDTRAIQRKLDAEQIITAGNVNFQLRPQISYIVSRRVNLNLYFDRTFNDPLVSNSFRRATTAGGVQLKFNLAD